jgi:penicillin-binding protein-related factor A (putative recombinase)
MEIITNIEYAYVKELPTSESRENTIRINLHQWLNPFIKEINEQEGFVFVIFLTHDRQEFFLDGISYELRKRISEYWQGFRTFENP